MRSTMPFWIKECASCGYCATDLTKADSSLQSLVSSSKYQALRNDAKYPTLATRFLRFALLLEARSDFTTAFASALRAAWACDDSKALGEAISVRVRALELASRAEEAAQPIEKEPGARELVVSDLLRRIRKFSEAQALANSCLKAAMSEVMREALELQVRLAASGDDNCHSMGELKAVQRQEHELRRKLQENQARHAAESKQRNERVIAGTHICPHCSKAMSSIRIIRHPSSATCSAICPSCGCSSPWNGAFPE